MGRDVKGVDLSSTAEKVSSEILVLDGSKGRIFSPNRYLPREAVANQCSPHFLKCSD